ncbi:MAG: YciI family protein [Candidatus Acidiferrales bacterium]
MRYMMIMYPRDYAKAKPGFVPDNEAIQRMSKYNEELAKARVLVTLDGLTPPATMSARVTFPGGKSNVSDGPFPESKEVVGGFWIISVNSPEEAKQWASRIPGSENEMVEVRRFYDASDFDPETVKKFEPLFAEDEYTSGNQK